MSVPRPEYPRPIMVREQWLNLNGEWQYQADPNDDGLTQRWFESHDFTDNIIVPYPIESEASGVHNVTPDAVHWYQRQFELPVGWRQQTLLHIGACDHWTRVFVNGQEVGQHRGGYVPIHLDITHTLQSGTNKLTLRVEDDIAWTQVRGKQAGTTKWPIDYDTVTGVWQTVWLEPVPKTHISALHSEFDVHANEVTVLVESSRQTDAEALVVMLENGVEVARGSKKFDHRSEAKLKFTVPNPNLWCPANPFLYDLNITLKTDTGEVDEVISYTGLRQVSCADGVLQINNEAIYLRGVLDQGYFPKGWYTPLDDDAILNDVQLTLDLGFNCARKHQKIEDPRYLYWADKLGLLVWEEMPSGRIFSNELVTTLTQEWLEVIRRDRQHPCIVAWVPFNESWGVWNQTTRPEQRAFVDGIVHLTRALDQSRWVVGNDGWEYSSGDLWTLHIYEGESISLQDRLDGVMHDPQASLNDGNKVGALEGAATEGLPILLTECGGVGYAPDGLSGDEFSYGEFPTSLQALETRFELVADTISPIDALQGFVWTQLTDVQQEINGVLYFDRSAKMPIATTRRIIEGIGAPHQKD